MNMRECRDASDMPAKRFENAPLAKQLDQSSMSKPIEEYDKSIAKRSGRDVQEVHSPIKNKQDGLEREHNVERELKHTYPEEKGYSVVSEAYLRNKEGKIVLDSKTGEGRRIDFVVVKDNKVVDSVEVTSKTADKTLQSAKENRIREAGGNYIRDYNGNLAQIPPNVHTRIERRD